MDNKKCTNDLCIKHINNIISVYDLSGCDKWFLRQLRSCEIYCRLNPLSKYYKLLVPADIEFKVRYRSMDGEIKSNPDISLKNLSVWSNFVHTVAGGLGIKCDYHEGQIGNEVSFESCIKTDCPKYTPSSGNHCKMMSDGYLDYCKHYISEPGYYKILVPVDVDFWMNYGNLKLISPCGLMAGLELNCGTAHDLGIQCTFEEGDIENG